MPASVYELHAANAASRLDQLVAYAGAGLAATADDRQRCVSHRGGTAARARCRRRSRVRTRSAARYGRCRSARSMPRSSTARSNACRDPEAVLTDLKRAPRPLGRRHGHRAHHRQPHGTALPIGLVGIQFRESSLLSADTLQSLLHQERLRRPDHRCRRQRGLAGVLPRQDPGGLVPSLSARPEASGLGHAAVPAAARVPLVEQPACVPRAGEAAGGCADAVGDRSRLQREGDVLGR